MRGKYLQATIICATTVLQHDASWDQANDDAVRVVSTGDRNNGVAPDPKVHHFLYSRNGSATPGHPRIAEHQEMADELTAFIESLGPAIWD